MPHVTTSMTKPLMLTCWECRQIRKVCDGTLPECRRCIDKGHSCPRYGPNKPVRFVQNGQPVLFRRRPRHNRPHGSRPSRDQVRQQTGAILVNTPFRALETPHTDAIQYLRDRNWRLLGDTFLGPRIKRDGPDTIATSVMPEVRNMCQTISALMYYIRQPALSHSHTKSLRVRMRQHTTRLGRMLEDLLSNAKTHAGTAATIIQVTFWTIEAVPELAWTRRAGAVMSIVNANGGWPTFLANNSAMKYTATTFLLNIILANTTSPSKRQFSPELFETCHEWLPDMYVVFAHPSFPCPWPLLSIIIHINTCRAKTVVDHANIYAIEASLEAFDPAVWVDTNVPRKQFRDHWIHLVTTVHYAVQIYFLATLAPQEGHRIEHLRTELFSRLQNLLHDRAVVLNAAVRFALFWPTIVAGYVANTIERRDFIRQRLPLIREDMCQLEPKEALDVLERYWDRDGRGGWDVCFDRPRALAV